MKVKRLLLVFTAFSTSLVSQTYVNCIWKNQVANPFGYDYVATALGQSGNLITTGNNKLGGATQIHINSANNNGAVMWQQNVSGSATNPSFGVDVKTDPSGNVYCVGAYHNGSDYDYRIAKYSNTGSLIWQQYYNGPAGNKDDIPTALVLDNSGNVFVTGSSWGNGGALIDYATLKLDNNGNQLWVARFNNGLIDAATSIRVDNSGNVFVSGASASNPNNANITTVKYSPTGAQLGVHSFSYPGNGKDLGTQIVIDFLGNIFVTGCVDNGTQSFVTLKLTNNLNLSWSNVMSGSLSEGYDVDVDNSGNVIAVGYQNNSAGGSDIIVNKFSPSGSLVWQKKMQNPLPSTFAKARKVKTDAAGNIYVAADGQINATRDFVTFGLSPNGETKWLQYYDSPTSGSDIPGALQVSGSEVYVTGITTNGAVKSISSVVYSLFEKNSTIVASTSPADYLQNELLTRFTIASVNPTAINNKELVHGSAADFLTPTTVSAMNSVLGEEVVRQLKFYKVFPRMVMADCVSVSRSGRTVKVLNHFTTFGIVFPTGSNDATNRTKLNSIPKFVELCDFNYMFYTTVGANDTEYTNGNSPGLNPTASIPNADINIEPAWDVTTGNSNIKVGIIDSGVNFAHQDFGNGTFSGSKIAGGWDYYSNIPLNTTTNNDTYGHGTGVAGFVGAFRNNSFGTSGIAGGDNLLSNPGVTLYDMVIFKSTTATGCGSPLGSPSNIIANAIVEGAVYNPFTSFGFGQHVQNHSYAGATFAFMYDAFTTAFDNEVVMPAGSGNADASQPSPCLLVSFPATFEDRLVMKVGANDATGAKANFSQCGFSLDCIAPGVLNLYSILERSGSGTGDNLLWGTGCSAPADGTSFSTPHVSGVASLLVSYANNTAGIPNPLYPEDCEQLIQYYATDLTATPNFPGYDPQTGYGRLNAGQTLSGYKYPDYLVQHYSFNVPAAGATLVGLHEEACLHSSMFSLPAGIAKVNRYELIGSTSHVVPSGYNFLDGWELSAGSNIYGINSSAVGNCGNFQLGFLPDAHEIIKNSVTPTSASFTGYIYELLDNSFNTVGWYPFDLTGTATFAYSLYLKSNAIGIEENSLLPHSVSVYPVPASDKIYLHSNLKEIDKANIKVLSTLGQTIIEINQFQFSENSFIDTSNLSDGVYFLNITVGNKTIIKKITVSH